MGKEIIIMFDDTESEKHKLHHRINVILLEDVDIKKYSYLVWFRKVKKIINILLVTKTVIIKLNHYT